MDEDIDLTPEFDEVESSAEAIDAYELTMERFFDVASVDSVYAEPVEHGDTTIIPCAEVVAGMGFGVGYGYGQSSGEEEEAENPENNGGQGAGGGGGGGGGGKSFARPVAVIVCSPEGVRVEPVVDVTKIALAVFTAGGFVFAMIARMARRQPPKFDES